MAKFYNIAHGTEILERNGNFPWPYDIDLCFEGINNPVAFSQGVAHGSGWASVSLEEALSEQWAKYFEFTKAQWLVPLLKSALENSEELPREIILKKAEAGLNGTIKSYQAKVS